MVRPNLAIARSLIVLAACCVARGDDKAPVRAATRAAEKTAAAASAPAPSIAGAADVRDVLLMLDSGPLHLRFHIALEGRSLMAWREAYIDRLMFQLDADGDGKLTADEAARSPLEEPKRRPGAAAFRDPERAVGRDEIRKQVDSKGGAIVAYQQDILAAGNDQEVFKFLDADASGFIDRPEMSAASSKILERDTDEDECISFQEFLPPPPPDAAAPLAVGGSTRPPRTSPLNELLRDTTEPLLPRRLLRKYDADRNGKLTSGELGWDDARIGALDSSGDGRLNVDELKQIARTSVDLELAVDLVGPVGEKQAALTVISTTGSSAGSARRPDVLRLAFPKTVLTLSFRKVDPIKSAIDNAMRAFNQIDVDGNGYLDHQETKDRTRFERGLFDALDADGDGKIFGEEMQKYVTMRGEPASTAAWVNVYDTGRGFFEALDGNGDGRISLREMQAAEKSLSMMKRDQSERIAPEDPVRNFHIEFLRGSFQLFLFGPKERLVAQTPSFEQRAAIGPIWFQRMDRNNDGDLNWNEFLGPRDVFHRIDKDGDGLIDPQEAAEVEEE